MSGIFWMFLGFMCCYIKNYENEEKI
jgi:hypothetical protein